MFFDVGIKKYYNTSTKKDEDIKLSPGIKYKYQFYIVVNGKEIKGAVGTFTTKGTSTATEAVAHFTTTIQSTTSIKASSSVTKHNAPHVPTETVDAKFTVTLNPNGGTVSPSSYAVDKGTSLTLPAPKRAGYTFAGWYNSNGTKMGNTVTVNGSATLTAQWTENSTDNSTTKTTTVTTATTKPSTNTSLSAAPTINRWGVKSNSSGKTAVYCLYNNPGGVKIIQAWYELWDSSGSRVSSNISSPEAVTGKYQTINPMEVFYEFGAGSKWYSGLQAGAAYTYKLTIKLADGRTVSTATGEFTASSTPVATTTQAPTSATPAAPTINRWGVKSNSGGKTAVYCLYNNPSGVKITQAWYELWDSSGTRVSSNINSPEVVTGKYQTINPMEVFYGFGSGSKWYSNLRTGATYTYKLTIKLEDGRTVSTAVGNFTVN